MNRRNFLIISAFMLICLSASAQFRKPITSPRDKVQSSEGRYNVGLVGGANFTTWFHIHGAQAADWYLARYMPQFALGYHGGIAFEYKFNPTQSLGLNVIYAQHNMKINHTNDHFPLGFNQYVMRIHELSANYNTIEAYVPFTYYLTLSSKRNIKPYVFVAPRVSYVLGGTMTHTSSDFDINTLDSIPGSSSFQQVTFNDTTYRSLNVGATVGVGMLFRINLGNYYFLVKADASANLNALSTFTSADLFNEFNHLRNCADGYVSITVLLPIKKQLKGACMKWGEYD